MSTKTLNTAIEKIAPTAIVKLDGPFNDFQAKEIIEISDDWWEALNAVPFVSCK